MKMKTNQCLRIGVPLAIAGVLLCENECLSTIIAVILMYLLVALNECCSHYESVYLFVLVGIISIPFNIGMCGEFFRDIGIYLLDSFAIKIVLAPLLYASALSIEEIVFGIIGRAIWRNQYPLF